MQAAYRKGFTLCITYAAAVAAVSTQRADPTWPSALFTFAPTMKTTAAKRGPSDTLIFGAKTADPCGLASKCLAP